MLAIDPIIHDLKEGSLVRKYPSTYRRNLGNRRLFGSVHFEDTANEGTH